jgi:fatty acid desaturase
MTAQGTPRPAGRAAPDLPRRSDYSALLGEVRSAGLLERRPGRYLPRIATLTFLWSAGWVAFVVLGSSWWQPVVAAVLAVAVTQLAFLAHDAGHRQVFATRRRNDLLGRVVGTLLVGLSYGWWIDKHTRHHAHPNQIGSDPDIVDGAVVFTRAGAAARTSPAGRWLARHQAALFFPMLLGEGFALRAASVAALWRRPPGRTRTMESLLLATHVAGYLALVFLVLPPLPAIGFVALHQGLFGLYMGCAFAPNHKGMPQLGGDAATDAAVGSDFLRKQVLTARNIRGGRTIQLLLGGLNYQIEHHLFPSMPSANLRHARPLVRGFCHDRGVAYSETSLTASYREVLRYLRAVGAGADLAAAR